MKNNKSQGMSISTIIFLILGLVILIILIMGFILGWNKIGLGFMGEEEFTIKKEVCYNETQKENFLCDDGSRGWINESKINVLKKIGNCYYFPTQEVCEQQEVDEIKYASFKSPCQFEYCFPILDLEERFYKDYALNWIKGDGFDNPEELLSFCEENQDLSKEYLLEGNIHEDFRNKFCKVKSSIPKSDLTKDWLDENCDLISNYNQNELSSHKCKTFGICYEVPTEYKCFDKYIVEVLR